MKTYALAGLAAVAATFGASAEAATIAQFTFETSIPTTSGPIAAEVGTGTASSNTGGAFTNPSGNGSAESFSSNGWDVGEYWQFSVPTTGYEAITVSFDAMGSNTGPRDFKIAYSTDGTTFTDFATYTLINGAWSASTPVATTSYSYNFSSISGLNDAAGTTFRLIDTSTTGITGGTVAATGTSRIDNFTVSGTTVPEPAALGLIGLVSAGLVARRRR